MAIDGIPGKQIFRQRDVRRTPASIQTQTQTNVAPIGAIFAWLKSFTNTPALISGWVECNGQTLSDGDSVYNGQVIPDLNGNNQFMRGNSTSGATGGSATMAHTHGGGSHTHITSARAEQPSFLNDLYGTTAVGLTTEFQTVLSSPSSGEITETAEMQLTSSSGATTGAASNTENRPPFYDVVWIMRIK